MTKKQNDEKTKKMNKNKKNKKKTWRSASSSQMVPPGSAEGWHLFCKIY